MLADGASAVRSTQRLRARAPEVSRRALHGQQRADNIGFYLNSLEHAAVSCIDEEAAIQALDQLDPVSPLSPGQIERRNFECYWQGMLPLRGSGNFHRARPGRDRCPNLSGFRGFSQRSCGPLSGHTTDSHYPRQSVRTPLLIDDLLQKNPRVQFCFTPTCPSWLDQVELRFGKIKGDLIACGVLTSVPNLARRIKCDMAYWATAKPL